YQGNWHPENIHTYGYRHQSNRYPNSHWYESNRHAQDSHTHRYRHIHFNYDPHSPCHRHGQDQHAYGYGHTGDPHGYGSGHIYTHCCERYCHRHALE
ncbi:MAG TPA: hypothetical protein VND68_14870, partial [Chloroflexia bacterium]|nr:hypothetical protein [Chloroflexia bacterium]